MAYQYQILSLLHEILVNRYLVNRYSFFIIVLYVVTGIEIHMFTLTWGGEVLALDSQSLVAVL